MCSSEALTQAPVFDPAYEMPLCPFVLFFQVVMLRCARWKMLSQGPFFLEWQCRMGMTPHSYNVMRVELLSRVFQAGF